MIVVIAAVGFGFVIIYEYTTTLYYEELTQRLNAPIAMYVTSAQPLISSDGVVNDAAMKELAERAMVINPAVEVYLLDTDGRIVDHAMPPGSVQVDRVPVAELEALINGAAELPVRSIDPRNPGVRKIFSAAEVRSGDSLQGYLYVVLGGQKFDELVSSIRGSYAGGIALTGIFALLTLGAASGLLAFALLTRRLRKLTSSVRNFSGSGLLPGSPEPDDPRYGDEIEQLGRTFRAMALRISEQVEQLKENDRLRRELVSNVSHDLRTPLASIQGYLETMFLKNGSLSDDERAHFLRIARRNALHLQKLVEDLFELSKLDAASVRPSFEWFSIAELLQDTAQEFQLAASEKNIEIETAVPQDSTSVHADIALIQRVLENLIRNAVEFTPEGGRIRIDIEKRPDSVGVVVSDTGIGIPEDNLPFVFERYYHRARDAENSGGSTGLGLAIVKRILELHGSVITVVSEPGRGSRFEFELPGARRAA